MQELLTYVGERKSIKIDKLQDDCYMNGNYESQSKTSLGMIKRR
jgi:hypothetical protein